MTWPTVALSDDSLFSTESGLWIGKVGPLKELPVVRNTNFTDRGRLDYSSVARIPVEKRLLPKKTLQYGDIVIERSGGGPKQPVGRVAFFDKAEPFSFSNFTSRLRVLRPDVIDPLFLNYFLLWLYRSGATASLQQNTTGIRNLKFREYLALEVPAPELTTQRAIAAVLSKIEGALDMERGVLDRLKDLKVATMAKLFADHSWPEVPLGEVAKVGNGSTPNRNEPRYWNGGDLPWLTSGKVHEWIIEAADQFVTMAARAECHLPFVAPSSILVAITGQGKTLGNAALVKFETCVNQHLAYITLQSDRFLPEFLLAFLQSRYAELRSVAQAGGTTKGALTCGYLKTLLIPSPSLDEQSIIGAAFYALFRTIRAAEHRVHLFAELFDSTLDSVMSDELSAAHMADDVCGIA